MAFELRPSGPFDLAEARAFLAGFGPAGQAVGSDPGALLLAFAVDERPDALAAVRLTQAAPDAAVHAEVLHGEPGAAQVERILSLDHDGAAFAALGERDPVLGGL